MVGKVMRRADTKRMNKRCLPKRKWKHDPVTEMTEEDVMKVTHKTSRKT